MVTWQLYEGKLHDTLALFSQMTPEQEAESMGEDIKIEGRWHNLVSGEGVAIVESDSAEAVSAYCLQWNKYMDLQIAVVVDDEQCRALGRKMAAED